MSIGAPGLSYNPWLLEFIHWLCESWVQTIIIMYEWIYCFPVSLNVLFKGWTCAARGLTDSNSGKVVNGSLSWLSGNTQYVILQNLPHFTGVKTYRKENRTQVTASFVWIVACTDYFSTACSVLLFIVLRQIAANIPDHETVFFFFQDSICMMWYVIEKPSV